MQLIGIEAVGPTNQSIVAEALRRGLEVTATGSGRVRLRGRGTYWWKNGVTNFNSPAVRRISPQKEICSRVFRSRGVRAPENAVFANHDAERAWGWASHMGAVVVKPYNASKGRGVNIDIRDEKSFKDAFEYVAGTFGDVLVEEFVSGTEHRFYVVDGRVVAVNRRMPANVMGNGDLSISGLITMKNTSCKPPHRPLVIGDSELKYLQKQGLTPDSVPACGQRVFLRANSNISTGGDSCDATQDVSAEEVSFVERAAQCWPGLRAGGIDVLLPREPQDNEPTILEVNHAAGIGGHHFPRQGESRDVAGAILTAMFPEST